MKRLFSLLVIVLVCMMALMPVGAAFASEDAVSNDGDDVMTILSAEDGVTTVGAEAPADAESSAAFDYSKYNISYGLYDGEGKETRNFSYGLSCGMSGSMTLFSSQDYKLSFIYVNDKNEHVADAVVKIIDCDPNMQAKYLSVEGNSVIVKSGNENYAFKIAIVENGEVTDKALGINVAKYKVEFSDILLLGIGVYALVTAITGTGAMFRNEFIKEGMEDKFKRYVRIASAVVGICMLGVAALSMFACGNEKIAWLKYTLFGIAIAALIASLIVTRRMIDKDKRAKAMAAGRTGAVGDSSAAFEFDEDEPTIDDVLAKMNDKKDE